MANLIIKSSADNLVLQGSDASPAITVGATGTTTFAENATMSGVTTLANATITAGTFPAGHVLQVLSTTKTDTFSHATTTVTTITGLTVAITPSSTSNKILIMGGVNFGKVNANSGYPLKIFKDSTEIGIGGAAGNRPLGMADLNMPAYSGSFMEHRYVSFLDSPNTTSAITYSFRIVSRDSTAITINSPSTDGDNTYTMRGSSTITVMEIKA
jgi:hypothetical protein